MLVAYMASFLSSLTEVALPVTTQAPDDEFIARGLRSADGARHTGANFSAAEATACLDAKLAAVRAIQGKKSVSKSL